MKNYLLKKDLSVIKRAKNGENVMKLAFPLKLLDIYFLNDLIILKIK
jgi:hypothetical protein